MMTMKKRMKMYLPIVRRVLTGAMPDVMCIAGCGCIVYAAWLVCTALSFFSAGVLLVIASFLIGGDGNAG